MPKKVRTNPEMEEICNQLVESLKKRREKIGMTTDSLAVITGILQPNINRMERFKSIPNLSTFVEVATALGLEVYLRAKKEKTETKSEGTNSY